MARNYANRASDGRRSRHRRYGALDGNTAIPMSRATELLELAEKADVKTSSVPTAWLKSARDVTPYNTGKNPFPQADLERLRKDIKRMNDNAITIHPAEDITSMMPIQIENASQALQRQLALYDTINYLVDTKFIPDVDYGIIPGTKKNSLLKPGIEKIMGLLGLRSSFKTLNVIRDTDRDNPFFYFEVEVELIHIQSDMIVAVGQGSCNSRESRFMRTQDRTCPTCGKETIRKSATNWYCWSKLDGCGAQFGLKDERLTSQTVGNVFDAQLVWNNVSNILKQANKRAEIAAVNEVAMLSGKFASMAINTNGQQSGQNSGQNSGQPSSTQQRPPNNPAPSAPQNSGQDAGQITYDTWLEVPATKDKIINLLKDLHLPADFHKVLVENSETWKAVATVYKDFDSLSAAIRAKHLSQANTYLKELQVVAKGNTKHIIFKTSTDQTLTVFTREPFRQAGWIASGSWDKVTDAFVPLAEAIPVSISKNDKGFWQIDTVHPAPDFFAAEETVAVPQDAPKPSTPSAPLPTFYGKKAETKPEETPAIPKWVTSDFLDFVEMTAAMTPAKALEEMERTGWHEFNNVDEARIAVGELANALPDLRNDDEPVEEVDRYADVPF